MMEQRDDRQRERDRRAQRRVRKAADKPQQDTEECPR